MCGRFVLVSAWKKIARNFDLTGSEQKLSSGGDIYPGQKSACIISSAGLNELVFLDWGLPPPWLSPAQTKKLLINARAETVASSKTFRENFSQRRCLVVADGFYEWTKDKKPYYFYMQNRRPFGLAGIYETVQKAGVVKQLFVIITTRPNELIAPLHERMPAIIPTDGYPLWLDNTSFDRRAFSSLLAPYPSAEMAMCPADFKTRKHLDFP